MLEWFVSSSVLIAVVIALRYALRGRISPRVCYALWGLVAVRLLVPFSPIKTDFSILSPLVKSASAGRGAFASPVILILYGIGAGMIAAYIVSYNLRFLHRLKKERSVLRAPNSTRPVYMVEALDTPCLQGIFSPSIYLPIQTLESETKLNHLIEHEMTHYRHGDPIWYALRCVCLILHWYNPLVWIAACLFTRDAELFCDADSLRRLGETERFAYADTVRRITVEKRTSVFLCATVMRFGNPAIRERIKFSTMKQRSYAVLTVLALAVAIAAFAYTMTGARGSVVRSRKPAAAPEEIRLEEEPEPAAEPLPSPAKDPSELLSRILQNDDALTLSLQLPDGTEFGPCAFDSGSDTALQLQSQVDSVTWKTSSVPESVDCAIVLASADGSTLTFADGTVFDDEACWNTESGGSDFLSAIRAEFDALEADSSRILFDANNARSAANAFIDTEYGKLLMELEPENPLLITDYRATDREIREISTDGSSILGSFTYTFRSDAPEGTWPEAELLESGKYSGHWEFILRKEPDGRWHCVELGTALSPDTLS